jgi:hypothetical protein
MKDPEIAVPIPEGKRRCSMCGALFDEDALIVKDGDMCHECRKKYADMAFLYCNKCGAVAARIPTGFAMGLLIKAGDVLHVTECPQCTPGVVKSIPLEVRRNEKG